MKKPLLSVLRQNTKLLNSIIFFTCWSQLHAHANSLFLNKGKNVVPIMTVSSPAHKKIEDPQTGNGKKSPEVTLSKNEKINKLQVNKINPAIAVSPGSNIETATYGKTRYYLSDIKEGTIGTDAEHPIDQVYDNIFNVSLDEKINPAYQYILEYDLYGAASYKEVSKVINDELATEGNTLQKNEGWVHQSEPVLANSVKQGINTIIFTASHLSKFSYKVRNLQIGVSEKKQNLGNISEKYNAATISKFVNHIGSTEKINLASAELDIPQGVLKNSENFSITALRDIDMPALSAEMINVTSQNAGYRFLPHGEHFSAPAKVVIGYDKSKIPTGYTEQDIRTYYFDRQQKKWIALEKDTLNHQQSALISKTTHFTDMVNGILKVPESPETGSYAPNSIKDIKAANPSEGIVSIAPPTPNSMGSVTTNFPIKLPAGRAGMQPSLNVSYSSEGGNGWMGIGWDLSIPAVSIDTRWGVPRYDGGTETEIYSFGGEQLTFEVSPGVFVLPNRNEGFNKDRVPDRQFYPRIEGAYNRIIRKGTNPTNYVWVITSKDGTTSYFGGDETGVKDNAVLKDANGNIGYWGLYKTVDANKNYVKYLYDNTVYQGNTGNGGQQIYPKEINYTLHETNNPAQNYKVIFNTDTNRNDVQIDGRLGFLKVISKRLTGLAVSYGSSNVRSYQFSYTEGAFKKQLLTAITELDANGSEFYTNRIEYENAPSSIFGPAQNWAVQDNANVSGSGYSMLSGSSGESLGTNFGISIGMYTIPNLPTADQSPFSFRKGTFGAHGSVSNNKSNLKITLIDIDGDNLPDRVYENGGVVYYSKNLSIPGGQQKFGPSVPVSGNTSEVGKTKVSAWGVGIDGNFSNVSLGFDYSNSTSTTTSYFMDFNSDGLIDFVKDGKVYFNRIVNGIPSFYPDSAGSPSPINITSSTVQQSLFDSQDQAEKKMMLEQNPLHDVVRVWVAPKTGSITVKNSFNLNQIACSNNEDCSKADGVAVSFQYKNNDPIVNNINAGDFTTHSFADQVININKGEKLYFRVTSKYDGVLDQVTWNPEIAYAVPNSPAVDSDNRDLSVYKAQEDFVNSNATPYYASEAGTLSLYLNKPIALSDNTDITLKVNDVIIPLPQITSASTYNNGLIGSSINLNANDKVTIKVSTDTQIDWSKFKLIPEFIGASGEKAYVQVEYTMYNDKGSFFIYPVNSSDVGKKISVKAASLPNFNNKNGKIVISAKFKNKLLTKTIYEVVNGNNTVITTFGVPYTLTSNDVAAGNNEIYLETTVSSDDRDFINNISSISGVLFNNELNYINTPNNLSLQLPNVNSTSHSDGTIVVGQATTLYFSIGNYAANTSAILAIVDTATGSAVNFPNGTLSGQSGLATSTSANLPPGVYTYSLNFFQDSSSNAYTQISILSGGSETTMISFTNSPPHKPILTPQNPTTALSSNQYDSRFGILYRGWGGFILNGNNTSKNTIQEAYNLDYNYANKGTVTEMKVDETRLALSNAYGTDPGANPPVNPPVVDANGNVVIPDNNSSLSKNYFIMMNSNISNSDKGRLLDVDPTIYIAQNVTNVSRLGVHSIDTNFDNYSTGQSSGDQLNAAAIKMKNQSISVAGGVSLGGVVGINASHTLFSQGQSIRNLLDYNGDGFPDDFNKKSIKLTSPIGAPSSSAQDLLNVNHSQSISSASTEGLSTGYSFSHGESSRMAFIRTVGSKNKDRFNNLEKAISSSHESQKGSTRLSISGNAEKSDEKSEKTFLDINGDGLPDLYDNGSFSLSIGRKDFANSASWNTGQASKGTALTTGVGGGISLFWGSFEGGVNTTNTDSDTKEELIDINGDGLPDKAVYSGSTAKVYINNGKEIEDSSLPDISAGYNFHLDQSKNIGGNVGATILIPIPTNPTATTGLKLNISLGVSTGKSTSKTRSTFKDMNGDGYPDFVTSDNENNIMVSLNQIGTTNLLKKVTTPMGGSWEVAYERLGNTYNMPQSKYVLKSVVTNDGFTGDNAFGPDVSKITVEYTDPYYSRRERTFYGFAQVVTNQIDTNQGGAASNIVYRPTAQRFHNKNYYLKGLLYYEFLMNAAWSGWKTNNTTYALRRLKDTNTDWVYLAGEDEKNYGSNGYACFVAVTRNNTYYPEGDTGSKWTSNFFTKYDQWGNVVEGYDLGDPDIGASEILTSAIGYTLVNPSAYIIMPTSVKIKNPAQGVTRERKAEYDTNGNLLRMIVLNQGLDHAVYDFEYDLYGNITKSKGPENYTGQRFFHQYTYDDNIKTYPVKVQDAFGYSSKTQYDFRFGLPTLTEDMNLQPMKYVYDAKARTTEIVGPYEMFNNIPWTIKFEYNPITNAPQNASNAQSYAVTKHYDPEYTDSTINTITIADGNGEAIQVKKTGDIYNEGIKYIVAGKVEKDAFGRALKTYYPTTESIGANNTLYNAAVDSIEPTINKYDILDRVVYTKLPGENLFSTVTYGFGTDVQGRNMFQTVFKDELGGIKKTYTDIKGRTTSVHEVSNTGDIKTQFTHDVIGELLQVKDVQNNITTSVYDDLGRRVSYTHPDSGLTTYKYDKASNMTSKTNSANEVVEYQYDYTRLKAVNYPVYPENNVKYYYGKALDASAMDNNAVGKLWYQTDATGTQYLKYGRLGELTYQRRSVAVPGAGVYWFGTEWQYDTWNRVKSITYPDGEVVTYKYNKAGNLSNVASVKDGNSYPMISAIGYDKFEQRVYLANGNGTKTTYEYETNRRRLLNMYAKNNSRYFMQNTYQYDVVSNVMQVHNNAPVVNGLLGGGTNYAFGYDDLYRLTSASGNWRGINTQAQEERHRYTYTMTYDNMHNIMGKTQKHEWTTGATNNNWTALEPTSYRLNYKYEDPAHPHAPTTIVDEPNLVPSSTCCNPNDPGVKFQHYKYDAKGNPTGIDQETCTFTEAKAVYRWDEENRLRFVDTNPSTPEVDGAAIYTYDAGGERIIKDVLQSGILARTTADPSLIGPPPPQYSGTTHNTGLYPNGLITLNFSYDENGTVTPPRYTKHYYAGSQRIVSKNGTSPNIGMFNCNWQIIPLGGTTPPINPVNVSNAILQTATQSSLTVMQLNSITPPPNYGQNAGYTGNCVNNYTGSKEEQVYWFHPDHLGSSSFITGADGEVTQNIEYFPSGETFVENHRNSNHSPYKFNGKELDAETGYYYYGARYYNPRVSLWLNVDPLAEKTPSFSPYAYALQNPVRYIDPTGMIAEEAYKPTPKEAAAMAAHVYGDKKDNILIGGWRVSERNFGVDLEKSSGFKSQVYERVVGGKVTEYSYVTAGTEDLKDGIADLKQPLGISGQYSQSAENARVISKQLGSTELTFIGHSLGGGEAAHNALSTGRSAITFNAAGVGDMTKFISGGIDMMLKSESKINAYIMTTDPLNKMQNGHTALGQLSPDVNGNRHYIKQTRTPVTAFGGHSIDTVLNEFGINATQYKKK